MIYLDNAATSFPKPPQMLRAMCACIENYCGNPGRSGHEMAMRTAKEIFKARNQIGKLLGIDNGERIIFTLNATESLNLAIKGILCRGDHVITTAMEHNSVLRPLKELGHQGVQVTVVPCNEDGIIHVRDIENHIRENTRLIICTIASNVTGGIMPVEEIIRLAHRENILFLLDASQGAGVLSIDVKEWDIDMLATPGHKGLLGPQGTGLLYVREGIVLRPLKHGGTGTHSQMLEQPDDFPDGYEAGTVNAPGIIGLGAAAAYIDRIGVERIRIREKRLTEKLDEALREMKNVVIYGPQNPVRRTGIVTFNIQGKNCEEVADILSKRFDIATRAGYHCAPLAHRTIGTEATGAVRASLSLFTTRQDIIQTIEAVHYIQKSR